MSVVYSTTVKNARLQVVADAIDGGSGPGLLVIGTSALDGATGVLAEIPLDDPCATVDAGVLTLDGLPNSIAATGAGTAAKAEIRDSDDVVIVSGLTVGTVGSAQNIEMNATAISVGQTVQVTSGTIAHG